MLLHSKNFTILDTLTHHKISQQTNFSKAWLQTFLSWYCPSWNPLGVVSNLMVLSIPICPTLGSFLNTFLPLLYNLFDVQLNVIRWSVSIRQCTGQFLHLNLVSITELTLKVPGWSLVCHELLSKKFPTFLSRLNKNRGGCKMIIPVSESFWSNLKFLRMMHLTAWLWGWNLRVNGMRSVFSFYYVCRADYRWIYWTPYLFATSTYLIQTWLKLR